MADRQAHGASSLGLHLIRQTNREGHPAEQPPAGDEASHRHAEVEADGVENHPVADNERTANKPFSAENCEDSRPGTAGAAEKRPRKGNSRSIYAGSDGTQSDDAGGKGKEQRGGTMAEMMFEYIPDSGIIITRERAKATTERLGLVAVALGKLAHAYDCGHTEQLIGAPLDRLTHHVHIQAGSARIRMAGQSLEQDEGLQREIPK